MSRALQGIVGHGGDEQTVARRICQACIDVLGVDGAAISLLTASVSRETLWASDATAQRLEDLQFGLNEGACMEAATSGRPVLVADVLDSGHTARWPVFAAAVAEQTLVGALFALPLTWGAVNLGVLDLYRAAPGALSRPQLRDALAAADTAALVLLGRRTDPGGPSIDRAGPVGEGGHRLGLEVGNRAEIHQATGMVLAQLDISATDALARMRGYAFVHQRLLVDVAHDVVARALVFTEGMT